MTSISLIATISENRVLADQGKIPWKIPMDVNRYRDKIQRHVIIAGRKTFDASYTETVNIVVTWDLLYKPPIPATVVHSIGEALKSAKKMKISKKHDIVMKLSLSAVEKYFKNQ